MQELDKILEEIDNLYVDETDFGIECNMENRSDVACDNCYECIKEACKKIIRKHMNDGWIPVDERLPKKNEYFADTSSDREFPNGYYKRLEIAYMTDTIEYVHGYYDGYKWMDKYLDTIKNVVAWRIHEPYQAERSDNNDGE